MSVIFTYRLRLILNFHINLGICQSFAKLHLFLIKHLMEFKFFILRHHLFKSMCLRTEIF